MAVCQFFLKGQCRFGDNCRNEHPANARQSGFGASSWNRTGDGNDDKLVLPFNATSISNDLTPHVDKPMWPLSSYAPSKHEPLLIPGLDESPEELRVKAAAAVASGNINAYLEYEGRQIAAADQMFLNARNNSAQAYDQAVKQSELPARLAAVTDAQTTTSPFRNNSNSTPALPSTSSAFSNTNLTTPAFGQSAFGHSTFGQPAFGQPAFGQPAFGQPSFGQTVPKPPTSTVSTTPTGAFGQPLNNAAPVSAFGQPLSTPASSIAPGFSAFATQPSAFSLAAQTAPTAGSVFGQPSFSQPVPATSVPTTTSVFGNPTPAPASVFGTPSDFGAFSQPPQQIIQQEQKQQTAPVWPSDNNSKSRFNSTFGAPTQSIPPPTKPSRTKSVFKPGSTPYDQQIPPNYKEALPRSVIQAFESQKFEWGDVPEWIPPVENR